MNEQRDAINKGHRQQRKRDAINKGHQQQRKRDVIKHQQTYGGELTPAQPC